MNKIMGILMLLVFACIATNILSGGSFVIPFNLQNLMVRTSLLESSVLEWHLLSSREGSTCPLDL